MKLQNKWKANKIIRRLARRDGLSPADVKTSMQEAIDEAWASDNPEVIAAQLRRFPAGKPTVEEFISALAREVS